MAIVITTTTIIIIAASIGGAFVLAATVGILLLLHKRLQRRRKTQNENLQRVSQEIRWGVTDEYHNSIPQPGSPEQFYRQPSKETTQVIRNSWMRGGLLPSREQSVVPAEWAVGNGSHVPRPHKIKKSKSLICRESALLGSAARETVRPAISSSDVEDASIFDISPKQTHVVQSRKRAQITPSRRSQVVSMIVMPGFEALNDDFHEIEDEVTLPKRTFAGIRRSLIFGGKSRSPSKSPNKKSRTPVKATPETSRVQARRSMSVPFVPTSSPPWAALPVIPAPLNHSRLKNMKKTRKPAASPSRESYISEKTVGSSVFDSLSPMVQKADPSGHRAAITGPKRSIRRRSSAPSLPIQSFFWQDSHTTKVMERKISKSSSQLLPSPEKPSIYRGVTGVNQNTISGPLKSTLVPIDPPSTDFQKSSVRARDIPFNALDLTNDLDVFGYGEQIPSFVIEREPVLPVLALGSARQDEGSSNAVETLRSTLRKPRVLQKKWTKQESYPTLAFATVPYSSTQSLESPDVLNRTDFCSSSNSGPRAEQLKGGSPFDTVIASKALPPSHRSSFNLALDIDFDVKPQTPKELTTQDLFGPRRMSSQSLLSVISPILPFGNPFERPQSRIADCPPVAATKTDFQANIYRFEEFSSDEDDEPPPTIQVSCLENSTLLTSHIDPPPVRLAPTPLRQSFYGYEARPSYIPYTSESTSMDTIARSIAVMSQQGSNRDTSAPRPPSSLSSNFRLSAGYPIGVQKSKMGDQAQNIDLPSAGFASAARTAVSNMKSFRETDRPISLVSTMHGSDVSSSNTATPLKQYKDMCDLFPKPLSVASVSRPPTWALASPAGSSGVPALPSAPASPRMAKRGLPPHPGYYRDQSRRRTSSVTAPVMRNGNTAGITSLRVRPSTTGKHSPLRRSLVKAKSTATANTQTTPSILRATNSQQHQSLRQGEPSGAVPQVDSLAEGSPSYKLVEGRGPLRESVLGPICVNIGSPTFFTGDSQSRKPSDRQREMSPSPSPRIGRSNTICRTQRATLVNVSPVSSQGGTRSKSPYGAIGEERRRDGPSLSASVSGPVSVSTSASKGRDIWKQQSTQLSQPSNEKLRRRIAEAKARKQLTGLGITVVDSSMPNDLPPRAPFATRGFPPAINNNNSTTKRKASLAKERDSKHRRSSPIDFGIGYNYDYDSALHCDTEEYTGIYEDNDNDTNARDASATVNPSRTHHEHTKRQVRFSERDEHTTAKNKLYLPATSSSVAATHGPSDRRKANDRRGEEECNHSSRLSNCWTEATERGIYRISFIQPAQQDGEGTCLDRRMNCSPGTIWREEVF